jgi:hypothetical protein
MFLINNNENNNLMTLSYKIYPILLAIYYIGLNYYYYYIVVIDMLLKLFY